MVNVELKGKVMVYEREWNLLVSEPVAPYKKRKNLIEEKSFAFALSIIQVYRTGKEKKEYDLARQLLRSGTAIGANVAEASAAQTKKDFIAKMAIASKEARETHYWLRLLHASQIIDYDFGVLLLQCEELIKILTAIVKTAQRNQK